MATKKTAADLKQFLDGRPLPKFFNNWITEKQLLQFIQLSPSTFKNIRYEKRLTYTLLFRIPLYYVPDVIALMKEAMVRRKK